MTKDKTFTFINYKRLAEIIKTAEKHIVYAAPGLAETTAQVIADFSKKSEKISLRVILDTDAEAIRLGFGDFSGIKVLTDRNIEIRKAEGLRIAVLIADEDAWIFSPTPEIIFEQPTEQTDNAIRVNKEFALEILQSIAPDISLVENILDLSIIPETLEPEIGGETITTAEIEKIDKSLKENPPQKFDAARKVRVYQGYFQFIELHLTGCRLTSHTINIPKFLLNIAEDNNFRNRINSTCRLVDDTSEFSHKIKDIETSVAAVRKNFTRPLGKNFGVVILRKVRVEFEAEIKKIQDDLKKLSEKIESSLQEEIDKNCNKLIEMLLPIVVKNPPKELTGQLISDVNEENARKFIESALDKVIPQAEKLIGEMELEYFYKDVTFESLNNPDFIKAIEEKYPYNNFAKLYSEEETIGERNL